MSFRAQPRNLSRAASTMLGMTPPPPPPPPPAYPARCARAPFVRTKGALPPSSPRKTTVIPAQAGIQRGNARRSRLNRDLKD